MTEAKLHEAVAAFLAYALPPDAGFFHPANGEKRDKATSSKYARGPIIAWRLEHCNRSSVAFEFPIPR